ncbi:MAG: hypothetical protein M1587_09260 [Thaumarchaeota archaeon]|nr:hypothetical protein [Nitrososphaerota archaeon]
MSERAKRYAAIQKSKAKQNDTLLIAHVKRTPKGKIRLSRIDLRNHGL